MSTTSGDGVDDCGQGQRHHANPFPGHRVARGLPGVACSSPRELPHQSQNRAGSNP